MKKCSGKGTLRIFQHTAGRPRTPSPTCPAASITTMQGYGAQPFESIKRQNNSKHLDILVQSTKVLLDILQLVFLSSQRAFNLPALPSTPTHSALTCIIHLLSSSCPTLPTPYHKHSPSNGKLLRPRIQKLLHAGPNPRLDAAAGSSTIQRPSTEEDKREQRARTGVRRRRQDRRSRRRPAISGSKGGGGESKAHDTPHRCIRWDKARADACMSL